MYPILYEIPTPWGRLAIFSYGVAMALAALGGWYGWVRRDGVRARLYAAAWVGGLIGAKLDWAASYGDGIFEGGMTISGFVAGVAFVTWLRGAPDVLWQRATPVLMLTAAAHALGQWLHGAEFHPLALYEIVCALVLSFAAYRQPSRALAWIALLPATHLALEPLRAEQSAIAYVLPAAMVALLGLVYAKRRT